jgi:hypothetical protein
MHIFHQIIKEREVNDSLNLTNQLDRRHQLISLNRIMFRRHSHHTSFFNNSVKTIKTLGKRFLCKGLERKCETPAGKTCQGETPRRKGAEEASPRPSAESKCLERKSTSKWSGKAKTVNPII